MNKKIAIVGAGASGLFCAVNLKKEYDVKIFCAETKLGKKILVTGNGKCNITNKFYNEHTYNQDITKFLEKFNYQDTLQKFNELGLEMHFDNQGRFYPLSNSAKTVVQVLEREINNNNVQYECECRVEKIEKVNNGYKVIANGSSEFFDYVVICTGSDNELIKDFEIECKPFSYSLCALKTMENTKSMENLRLSDIKATLKINKDEFIEYGEVLIKEKGLSGICIFNLSSHLARLNNYNAVVSIDLLPKFSIENLYNMLSHREVKNAKTIKDFVLGLFEEQINNHILKVCGFNGNENINLLNDSKIMDLAYAIKNLEFHIVDCYNNYQVKSGGVLLKNLDDNLQVKKYPNMFIAGELLNVDGVCGGYNLQWAWTSAFIIANYLNKNCL